MSQPTQFLLLLLLLAMLVMSARCLNRPAMDTTDTNFSLLSLFYFNIFTTLTKKKKNFKTHIDIAQLQLLASNKSHKLSDWLSKCVK